MGNIQLCKAKVDDFENRVVGLVREQQVFRLQIAMHNTVAVQEIDRRRQNPHVVAGLLLRKLFLLLDTLKQLAPAHQLHDNVHVAVVAAHVNELHHVGMSCEGKGGGGGVNRETPAAYAAST